MRLHDVVCDILHSFLQTYSPHEIPTNWESHPAMALRDCQIIDSLQQPTWVKVMSHDQIRSQWYHHFENWCWLYYCEHWCMKIYAALSTSILFGESLNHQLWHHESLWNVTSQLSVSFLLFLQCTKTGQTADPMNLNNTWKVNAAAVAIYVLMIVLQTWVA